MNRVKEQREQQNIFMSQIDEERTRMAKTSGERVDDNGLVMRSLLQNIERKVDEEVTQR
jgi:hypothetical protein